MKKLSLSIVYFLFAITPLLFTSCTKEIEGCMDANAENFDPEATIDNNNCIYSRDKFIGDYEVMDFSNSTVMYYGLSVTESMDDVNSVILRNLNGKNYELQATISRDIIQVDDVQVGFTFSGSGNYKDGIMTIVYSVRPTSGTSTCSAICTKK